MNFAADASVAVSLIALLRERGHTVTAIREIRPDMADHEVLDVAYSRNAVLLTEDKDFGDQVVRQGRPFHGLVLLRLNRIGRADRARFACAQITRLGERVKGALTVIGPKQVRVRRLA